MQELHNSTDVSVHRHAKTVAIQNFRVRRPVIARSVFYDEAIPYTTSGDCELKKQASAKNASQ